MNSQNVKPISSGTTIPAPLDNEGIVVWHFGLEPEADSKISVSTNEFQPVTIPVADVHAALFQDDVETAVDALLALFKKAQPELPDLALDRAHRPVGIWVQNNWTFFTWLKEQA